MSDSIRIISPTFNEKQKKALESLSVDSPVEQVLYGGGVYSGKSWLGCYWQIVRRLKYPNTRGLIGRHELKNLQLSTMKRFWSIADELGLKVDRDYTYNGQYNFIRFNNGSEILLMDMKDSPSDPDFHRFGSIELTDYFLDEVAEISKKAVEILDSRVRYNLPGGRPKGLLTCNPSHTWIYPEFYKQHKDGTLPVHKAFIEATIKDNTINPDPVYEAKMARLPEKDRKRLLEGDWDFDQSPDRLFEYDALLQMFNDTQGEGKMYITCDPAAMGDDRTVIGIWKGLNLIKIHEFRHKFPHEVATILRQLAQDHQVPLTNVIVDSDGLGIGVKGILKCREFLNGSSAIDKSHYANLKSECYFKLSEYVRMNRVHINDHRERDTIIKELDIIRDTSNEDKKKTVTRKEDIKAKHGFSPDYADMIMMRMFFELKPNYGVYSYA